MLSLIIAEAIVFVSTVLIVIAAYTRAGKMNDEHLRGLALPRGSVRAIFTLWLVGSFAVFTLFGEEAMSSVEAYQQGLSALSGVTGSVLGFYFGGRSATPLPESEKNPASKVEQNSTST